MAIYAKILMTMLVIDMVLLIGNVNTGNNLLIFGDWLSVNIVKSPNGTINQSASNFTVNGTLLIAVDNSTTSGGITSTLSNIFLLPIYLVADLTQLIIGVFFAPVVVLSQTSLPIEIKLLTAGSIMVLYAIGIVGLIRGGD